MMVEPINSNPLQKTIEEAHILHNTLLDARTLSHDLEQEDMKIPFSKEDPLIKKVTPIHIKEEEMHRRETLSDYLQECESQTKRFKDHIKFQDFCKIKEERSKRSKHHDVGKFFLSTFYGSPKCLARAWVEVDTYL